MSSSGARRAGGMGGAGARGGEEWGFALKKAVRGRCSRCDDLLHRMVSKESGCTGHPTHLRRAPSSLFCLWIVRWAAVPAARLPYPPDLFGTIARSAAFQSTDSLTSINSFDESSTIRLTSFSSGSSSSSSPRDMSERSPWSEPEMSENSSKSDASETLIGAFALIAVGPGVQARFGNLLRRFGEGERDSSSSEEGIVIGSNETTSIDESESSESELRVMDKRRPLCLRAVTK